MNASTDLPEIDHFSRFVALRYGLSFDDSRQDQLSEALANALRRNRGENAASYLRRLEAGRWPKAELTMLLRDLTVAETYFFRHSDQFQAVAERIIPEQSVTREPRRLRVLSAGCASGEEAYSLALVLRDAGIVEAGWDVSVLGIDVNANLLAKADEGTYTDWSLRGVSHDVQQRSFRQEGSRYHVEPSVRKLTQFAECNLLGGDSNLLGPDAFDVIFCRNVVMYFTPEAVRAVIARLTRALRPGGYLFLGPAETLRGISHDFHLQHTHGTFYYQRRSADENASRESIPQQSASSQYDPLDSALPAATDSWVTTIRRATARVDSLSKGALATARRPAGTHAAEQPRSPLTLAGSAPVKLAAARELAAQERFQESLTLLEGLSRLERQSPDAMLLHAAILVNNGQVRDAEPLCRNVLVADELNAEAHYLLALCREHVGEIGAAIEQDQTATYLDPQFAMPHLHLGLLAKRRHDRSTARRSFRQAASFLVREDLSRIALFGGGFGREALIRLCEAELRQMGGSS